MKQYRDLTVLPLNDHEQLVIACDSSASIGRKPADSVAADPSITAAFCLRVPLLELLAVGSEPLAVIDMIGNEYEETGRQMLTGIRKELAKAELAELPLNGSTEENMPTAMSTVGITVIGKAQIGSLRIGRLAAGDQVFYLGKPYVGVEVLSHLKEIFTYTDLRNLLGTEGVKEVLPVGSKGILYEADCLADSSNLKGDWHKQSSQPSVLLASAGPATVLVVGISPQHAGAIQQRYQLEYLGTLIEKEA